MTYCASIEIHERFVKRSESIATEPTASALAVHKAMKITINQGDIGKTHNSSNSAKSDRVEDTGGAAGFIEPTYSTLDDSEVKVPTDVCKAVDDFLVLDELHPKTVLSSCTSTFSGVCTAFVRKMGPHISQTRNKTRASVSKTRVFATRKATGETSRSISQSINCVEVPEKR